MSDQVEEKTLDQLIAELADAQHRQWTIENQIGEDTLAELKEAKQAATSLENQVRVKALHEFVDTGDVYPHDIVEIQIKPKKTYDDDVNVQRIIEHDDFHFLKIDEKAFKKAVEEGRVTYAAYETIDTPTTILSTSKLWRYRNTPQE